MRVEQYATEWTASQRDLSPSSLRHLDSLLVHHLYPAFQSRRMGTFDHKVVEAFIQSMERKCVGLATQSNAFDKLKSILLDAHRLGLYDDNPLDGVKPPQYDPKRAVIPSPAQLHGIRASGRRSGHRERRPTGVSRSGRRPGCGPSSTAWSSTSSDPEASWTGPAA